MSCWSSFHVAYPLPFDPGRKPGLDLFPPFTLLEGPAVDTALGVYMKNPEFLLGIQTCETFFTRLFIQDPESVLTFFGLAFLNDVEGGPLAVRDVWVCNTCARNGKQF